MHPALLAPPPRQGRLKLNPNRPSAKRSAWEWGKPAPGQLIELHHDDGTFAALVDVADDLTPLPGFSARWEIEHRLLLDAVESRWASRPEYWRSRWYGLLDELAVVIADVAYLVKVDTAHVHAVAKAVAKFSSNQGKPVWPKVARLQADTGLSRTVTFRCLQVLRRTGFLESVGQIVVRSDIDPGALVGGPVVRLLTLPDRVLRALKEAREEMAAHELERRRIHHRVVGHTRTDDTAPVVAAILGRTPTAPEEPEGHQEAVRGAESPSDDASVTARGLAAARAALAAAKGG